MLQASARCFPLIQKIKAKICKKRDDKSVLSPSLRDLIQDTFCSTQKVKSEGVLQYNLGCVPVAKVVLPFFSLN